MYFFITDNSHIKKDKKKIFIFKIKNFNFGKYDQSK